MSTPYSSSGYYCDCAKMANDVKHNPMRYLEFREMLRCWELRGQGDCPPQSNTIFRLPGNAAVPSRSAKLVVLGYLRHDTYFAFREMLSDNRLLSDLVRPTPPRNSVLREMLHRHYLWTCRHRCCPRHVIDMDLPKVIPVWKLGANLLVV
ncbi:hypothetical protein M413DRAFT_440727 [Hebeloma cylindrosporum]|uniref:Uncharacterized protein n=1 Tax=Hebeloma cylindrosporum TaxID=76867 RepID=A0A0C3CEQ6_HEBCY|nr:hypothetical protein M413DRAFT_440727 [Hebeloma cylindrosporum h7]